MTSCLHRAFGTVICASTMMRPKSWWTAVVFLGGQRNRFDEFKAVCPPVVRPVFLLFLSCFSPVVSAQVAARMVNPARDAGAKGKNRRISTNELLKAEIIEQDQVLAKRAVSHFLRPKICWTGAHALCIAQEPAR